MILRYNIPNTFELSYFGNFKREVVSGNDIYSVKILLAAAKKSITRRWCKEEPPAVDDWKDTVEEIFELERLTHKVWIQQFFFEKKWAKWTTTPFTETPLEIRKSNV